MATIKEQMFQFTTSDLVPCNNNYKIPLKKVDIKIISTKQTNAYITANLLSYENFPGILYGALAFLSQPNRKTYIAREHVRVIIVSYKCLRLLAWQRLILQLFGIELEMSSLQLVLGDGRVRP